MLRAGLTRPLRATLVAPGRRTLIAQPSLLPNGAPPSPLPTALRQNSPETQAAAQHMAGLVDNLNKLRAKAREGGGKATLEKWRARGQGKLGARER
jgi:3-methylcrotonyl-CoA carboxylase beta subunit